MNQESYQTAQEIISNLKAKGMSNEVIESFKYYAVCKDVEYAIRRINEEFDNCIHYQYKQPLKALK